MQLELDEESRKFMVINTHKGLKRYNTMTYGVKPATGIFQRIMENLLRPVPITVVRVVDILVSGKTSHEHLDNIKMILEILNEVGLTVNKDKCQFFLPEVEYLGFIISKDGVQLNKSKVEAINNAPSPTNLKEVQSFLGGINY